MHPNLVPRACDPREGTRGSGIIRFREESDWPLKWNAQFNFSQDSWLPATDYPRASRSFPRIAGSGNEIGMQPWNLSHSNYVFSLVWPGKAGQTFAKFSFNFYQNLLPKFNQSVVLFNTKFVGIGQCSLVPQMVVLIG